jgi:hypothetical protein
MVEDQIYDLARERDAAIAAGGSKLDADKVYALASAKVYKDAADAKVKADKEAADKLAADAKDAQDKYLAAVADYASKQQNVQDSLTRVIIDNYSKQEGAAVRSLEKERDATIKAINTAIDARQRQLDITLNAISREKDASLNQYDSQIQALENAHSAAQRADTLAGLQADVASATTGEERLRAQKALNKELADEAYNDQLAGLRSQRQAASDSYDARTKTVQSAADKELQTLKDSVIATQTSYDERITATQSYYDDLKLERNASAEAEKMLASATQTDIIKMLTDRLGEWRTLGTQISDAMFGNALAAKATLLALTSTNAPGTETPVSPTWNQGAGQAGYGNFPVHGNGGYFTVPHIATIAESGPEWVIPQSRAGTFASQIGGGNSDTLLRDILHKLDELNMSTRSVAPGVGAAINGMGRL